MKKNITEITDKTAYKMITQNLSTYTFQMKNDTSDKVYTGWMADKVPEECGVYNETEAIGLSQSCVLRYIIL